MRSPQDAIGRRALPHDPPHFIGTSDAVFFITICCEKRGRNQLCEAEIANEIFASARFYFERGVWGLPLLVLMPDHLHLLATFGERAGMRSVIRNWKRYLTNHVGIRWQRDFFDHRLRNDENFEAKANYILNNPVRAGLVARFEDWPYQIQLR
jgi:REP-associated tyrosine transposase